MRKSFGGNVRCVRGVPLPATDLLDNKDGTVTDRSTGLTWQQKDDNTKRSWKDALTYCEGLELPAKSGQKDWRLPNIKELSSIMDRSMNNPTIDTNFFPDTNYKNSECYWSSTIYAYYTIEAWNVYFRNGSVHSGRRSDHNYVHCVRGGQ